MLISQGSCLVLMVSNVCLLDPLGVCVCVCPPLQLIVCSTFANDQDGKCVCMHLNRTHNVNIVFISLSVSVCLVVLL